MSRPSLSELQSMLIHGIVIQASGHERTSDSIRRALSIIQKALKEEGWSIDIVDNNELLVREGVYAVAEKEKDQ